MTFLPEWLYQGVELNSNISFNTSVKVGLYFTKMLYFRTSKKQQFCPPPKTTPDWKKKPGDLLTKKSQQNEDLGLLLQTHYSFLLSLSGAKKKQMSANCLLGDDSEKLKTKCCLIFAMH